MHAIESQPSILDHVPYRTDHDHDGSWNMKCTDWVRTLRTSGGKDTRGSSRVEPTLFGDAAIVSAAAFSRLYRFPSAVTPFRRIIHTWDRREGNQCKIYLDETCSKRQVKYLREGFLTGFRLHGLQTQGLFGFTANF